MVRVPPASPGDVPRGPPPPEPVNAPCPEPDDSMVGASSIGTTVTNTTEGHGSLAQALRGELLGIWREPSELGTIPAVTSSFVSDVVATLAPVDDMVDTAPAPSTTSTTLTGWLPATDAIVLVVPALVDPCSSWSAGTILGSDLLVVVDDPGIHDLIPNSHHACDQSVLSFNISHQLASEFHWNMNQLFVYLVATYNDTASNMRNEASSCNPRAAKTESRCVCSEDRIVRSTDAASFKQRSVMIEYPLKDQHKELRSHKVRLHLRYRTMPIVGLMHEKEVAIDNFQDHATYFVRRSAALPKEALQALRDAVQRHQPAGSWEVFLSALLSSLILFVVFESPD
eukprot:s2481_g3.t1